MEVLKSASCFLTVSFFILPCFAWQEEVRTFGRGLLCEIIFLAQTRVGNADVSPPLNKHLGWDSCSCVLVGNLAHMCSRTSCTKAKSHVRLYFPLAE